MNPKQSAKEKLADPFEDDVRLDQSSAFWSACRPEHHSKTCLDCVRNPMQACSQQLFNKSRTAGNKGCVRTSPRTWWQMMRTAMRVWRERGAAEQTARVSMRMWLWWTKSPQRSTVTSLMWVIRREPQTDRVIASDTGVCSNTAAETKVHLAFWDVRECELSTEQDSFDKVSRVVPTLAQKPAWR